VSGNANVIITSRILQHDPRSKIFKKKQTDKL